MNYFLMQYASGQIPILFMGVIKMKNLGYYNGKYDEIENMQIPMLDRVCWFGDGVSDIAARFALREGTVKSNLYRIREKLRHPAE